MADEIPQGEYIQPHEEETGTRIAPNLPVYYANTSKVNSSFYDIRIVFAEGMQATPTQAVVIDRVSIVMSPEHTKALVEVLTKTLETYEATFGKLRALPPQTITSPPPAPSA